jgi:hypothetical protein
VAADPRRLVRQRDRADAGKNGLKHETGLSAVPGARGTGAPFPSSRSPWRSKASASFAWDTDNFDPSSLAYARPPDRDRERDHRREYGRQTTQSHSFVSPGWPDE